MLEEKRKITTKEKLIIMVMMGARADVQSSIKR